MSSFEGNTLDMGSIHGDQSAQPLRFSPQKRDATHLTSPSPTKRLKTANALNLARPALSSPISRVDRVGRFGAEQWFNDANQDASKTTRFLDNDPPFYIHRRPSSDGNNVPTVHSDRSSLKHPALGKPTAPTRSLLAQMESSESNSGDYRSVIDDLTIQNKKLKKRLKRFEKLHCSHLQDEKLFEVRIHGLAAPQKRELEQTLRSFASSIEDDPLETPTFIPKPRKQASAVSGTSIKIQGTNKLGFRSMDSMAPSRKPSSVSTSCSKPIDSAYTSMSGQTSFSQLQPQGLGQSNDLAQSSRRQQRVKSSLHDIPETLVPKDTMLMSEQAKSKMVVKRLEQIFTGKEVMSPHHAYPTQSHQQGDAIASASPQIQIGLDVSTRGRHIAKEGIREAQILPDGVDLQIDSLSDANTANQQSTHSSKDGRESVQGAQSSTDQVLDQRPTRPLDLDLQRPQVPAENIDYIRHLGLSFPTASTDPATGNGWVYLNLLASMAQLHTLNVTPEFIRHAIAEVSSRFELSTDGTKVKWQCGNGGNNPSSGCDKSYETDIPESRNGITSIWKDASSGNAPNELGSQDCQEPNAALTSPTYLTSNDSGLGAKRRPISLAQGTNGSDFHYKPLFFYDIPSENGDESDLVTNSVASSDLMENETGTTSGINSGSYGLRETEIQLREQNTEYGPIIFYHKARFCTDLSGDPIHSFINENAYKRYTQEPLGCVPKIVNEWEEDDSEDDSNAMELDRDSTKTTSSLLDLDDLKSCVSDCFSRTGSEVPVPVPMEVSGLGGIQPEDNFIVNVKVNHHDKRKESHCNVSRPVSCSLNRVLQRPVDGALAIRNIPRNQPTQMPIMTEVISTARTDLEPSSLPPPSYVCLPFSSSASSSESEGHDDDDDSAVIPNSALYPSYEIKDGMSLEPKDFPLEPGLGEIITSHDALVSSDTEDDDDSIDLLAHARVLDPKSVAERERDFEQDLVLAGSIAATAGGSSFELRKTIPRVESDVDSMSVDGVCTNRMDDSD